MPPTANSPARPPTNPLVKLLIEAGPLAVFFVVNARVEGDRAVFEATKWFMVAIVTSLLTSWRLERRLPIMPLVTAVFVLVFGGLTLLLEDETFIKLKPTIVNLLFAAVLGVGLLLRRPLLKPLFGPALHLREQGWMILTRRWTVFFVFLALLNELVWRSTSTEFWAGFKLFGIMPITILFTLTQVPLLQRYQIEAPDAANDAEAPAPADDRS